MSGNVSFSHASNASALLAGHEKRGTKRTRDEVDETELDTRPFTIRVCRNPLATLMVLADFDDNRIRLILSHDQEHSRRSAYSDAPICHLRTSIPHALEEAISRQTYAFLRAVIDMESKRVYSWHKRRRRSACTPSSA